MASKANKRKRREARMANKRHLTRVSRYLRKKYGVSSIGLGVPELCKLICQDTEWPYPSMKADLWDFVGRYAREILQDTIVPKPVRSIISKQKEREEFYASKEWRILRMQVILKYGRVCMCCGADKKKIHVDHIKPRSKYPALELDFNNLQILCEDCNMGKGAWDETDWRSGPSDDEVEDDPMTEAFRATIGPKSVN